MSKAEQISDAELNAYVDGQLAPSHIIEIEQRLATNPELAARVMADLSMRDSLRFAFADEAVQTPPQTRAWARKLEKALASHQRVVVPLRRFAAAAAIFALGWSASLGWTAFNRAPDQTAILNEAARLAESVNVRIPGLPDGWTVVNARLTETEDGPGVQLSFNTPQFGRLSLVARNTGDVGIVLPTVNTDEERKIHWQLVSDRYELTSKLTGKPLEYAALELYQTLY